METFKTKRTEALAWWNTLTYLEKQLFLNKTKERLLTNRDANSVTGREVQTLYENYIEQVYYPEGLE